MTDTDKKHISTFSDIFKVFWKGIRPQKVAFFSLIAMFIGASISYLFIPLFYKQFFDLLTQSSSLPSELAPRLLSIVFQILALGTVGWALFRTAMLILNKVETGVMARLKQIAFDYALEHSHTYFSNTFTGSMVQRVNRFGRAFEHMFDTLVFSLIPILIHTVGASVIVWTQNRTIGYVIMGWIVSVLVLNVLFSKWKLKYDRASAAADSTTTARLADTLGNHHTVATFTGVSFEAQEFKDISNVQARAQWKTWNFGSILDMAQSGLMVLVEFLLFYFSVGYWEEGRVTVGMFVLFQVYIISLGNRMWDFGRVIRTLYEGYSDSQETVDMLITPHEIKDRSDSAPLLIKGGGIEVDELTFGYGELPPVYDKLSLSIPAGQKIALVGHSGSGKSTFVKLLMRMYDLRSGMIRIDGQAIDGVTQVSLRGAIAHVPQDPVLFHRTLLENIRYGRRDATEEEVKNAARLAHCDDFIEALPQQYETLVGERGVKLSGGERQRVAIARAILKNAPILILDEATSSLDSHSEALIQEAMDELMKGKTVIAIAHRLSTIKKMDRIIVFDKGKIAEDGTHEELLTKKGIYSQLWDHQSGGYMKQE